MSRYIVVAVTVLIVAACGSVPDRASCHLEAENYLEDADFALEAQSRRSKYWTGIQHGGEKSFAVSIADGVVSLARIGSQPWYIFRQRLRSADLGGQRMAFTAQLRLLEQPADSSGKVAEPDALALSAISSSGKLLLRVEQRLGADGQPGEWQKVQLIALLPPQTEIVELGFLRQSDGILQVRNPSFRQVDPASRGCVLTPAL